MSRVNYERETLASTDCVGALGGFGALDQVWPRELGLIRLEMIGWRGRIDGLLKEAEEEGYTVVHLHGRIGKNPNNPLGWLTNTMVIPTPELVQRYGKEYEIVLHAANLSEENKEILKTNELRFVWVENCSEGMEGISTVTGLVKELKNNQVQAGIMFDLAHFIGGDYLNGSEFFKRWDQALSYIEEALPVGNELKDSLPLAIHFPLGTNKTDSLPIDSLLSDEMLVDLAAIINSRMIASLVIENKQAGWSMTGLVSKETIAKQQRRNLKLYERLEKAGLI